MKTVILAGGLGSRISEETVVRPKPMIEIGGKPIIWHIMKIYAGHGITEFVVCLGYKGYVIKEYFANYWLHTADVTLDLAANSVEVHEKSTEPWKVTLVDTGDTTMTGGRLRRVMPYVRDDTFCLTYGDGVADVDIARLVDFHHEQGTIATVTGVQPPGRFGALEMTGSRVHGFAEKPEGDGGWINGGFFVLDPEVERYLGDDTTIWERDPLEGLARDSELAVYQHHGFWQPMDTQRDMRQLQQMWDSQRAPWKSWT
jgi:glucose-1-phosphate cytidylyltransferase